MQSSQINEYLSELEKKEKKQMIYLIPENYKYEKDINEVIKNKKNYAEIYYWEDFIRYIENSDLPQSNILISEFIAFLKSVLGKQDLSLTLNIEEMVLLQNPKDLVIAKNLLNKLYDIIDESSQKVVEHFGQKIKIYEQTKRKEISTEYAVYFTDEDGEYVLFFGLWFAMIEDNIEKFGNKLMCFGVSIEDDYGFSKYSEAFKKTFKNNSFETGGWLISSFDKYILAKDDDELIIKEISNTLISTIEQLIL